MLQRRRAKEAHTRQTSGEVERPARKSVVGDSPDVRKPVESPRQAEPSSKSEAVAAVAARLKTRQPIADSSIATFDVGGRVFKISAKLVLKKKSTLLAELLMKEEGSNGKDEGNLKPIYVDASPLRFSSILDWYRYGEIYLPSSVPVGAFLQDAQLFKLPNEVIVNGCIRSVREHDKANKVGQGLVDNIVARWSNWKDFFEDTLQKLETHYENVGNRSAASCTQEMEEAWDFPPFIIPLYTEKGYADPANLGNGPRARVLALKLEERGYRCEFSETDLVVSLPLQLVGEEAGTAGGPVEEEGIEEDGKGAY